MSSHVAAKVINFSPNQGQSETAIRPFRRRRMKRRSPPPGQKPDHQLIEEFLANREVTRCKTMYAAGTVTASCFTGLHPEGGNSQ